MSVNRFKSGVHPFLFLLISLLMLSSCRDGSVQEKPVQPNDFVSTFTSGQVSSGSQIRVVLNLPEEFEKISDQELPPDVLSFKPQLNGKTYWADQFTIAFEPDEPLPNGKSFEARLDLDKLLGIKDQQNSLFNFYFSVIPLSFSLELVDLIPYQKQKSATRWHYLEGRLVASDHINDELVDKLFTAKQERAELKVTSLGEVSENVFEFRIDSIQRLDEASSVKLKWIGEEEISGLDEDNILSYTIPPLNSFNLMKVMVFDTPDQFVKLEFSDPVDEDQNLDGLIYFSDQSRSRISIENNAILIYPVDHQTGDKSITIKKQVRTANGIQLPDNIIKSVHFGQQMPAARFTSEGNIMPGEKGWILPFEAVNLSAVDVIIKKIYVDNVQQFLQVNRLSGDFELQRVGSIVHRQKVVLNTDPGQSSWKWVPYALDLSEMIRKEPGAVYRVELRFNKSYSMYDCNEDGAVTGNQEEVVMEPEYYERSYYYPSGYTWRDRDDPCTYSYYNYSRFPSKNVLASNIGLTVKQDNERLLVYVNDLTNTRPMADVKISLFDFQQQEINSSTTNPKGVASLDARDKQYLLVAEKDGQFAYQRLDGGSALSYSRFDTKGESVQTGIKGFIYGERGVWRPGDTIFLSCIIDDRANPLPEKHPVTLRLTNPRGKQVAKKTSIKGVNGFYTFIMPTSEEAMTGFWRATVEVGGASFEKTIRIETIKPNRLKINLDFNKTILTLGNNKATMNVRWLHGGIASNLKADVNITIRPINTTFEGFESFNFDDPARYFSPEDKLLFEGKLDSRGKAGFDFSLPRAIMAPGMLKVSFATKVYEHGGDFSIDQTSTNYAPFDYFIGISDPKETTGDRYLEVDKAQEFKVVIVTKEGKPVNSENLEVEVYKLDWSWWYSSNSRNLASYISSNYDRKVFSGRISMQNGKGSFQFKLDYPEWGWYYVRVKHPDGGHQTGLKVYFDWPSWYSRENRKAPGSMSLLSLSTNKDKFQIGEEVKVSVPAPANGRLLVAIEKGNQQITSWEMMAEGDETLVTFEATPEMAPNVYLYVSVFQPHNQTVNDLPIRMYGIVPVMIEDAKTVLIPELDVPKEVRPLEPYKIKVSEKNGRRMTYTLAIVDEGLLDLTKFRTPRPHKHFYAKEALSVKTWDLYDDVMGAFGGRLEKVFSIGGDMEMDVDSDKKKANRFKPVVTFLGPFELKQGSTRTHELDMPNYIGSVRCMVIAGQDGAYGNTDKTIPVRKPLMVLGTLPRVLAPGEKTTLPLSIFVMDEKIEKVKVQIETNETFIVDNPTKEIRIDGIGEHMAYFDVGVAERQGVGKVKVVVSHGKEKAVYEMELRVRNPNPRIYEVAHHLVEAGQQWDHSPEMIGIEGTNELNLTVSATPPLNLERRLKYLIRYPYGCIEQTTSSVFPQLYLDQLLNLDEKTKKQVEQHIKNGIKRINSFALSNGSFSYWPGGGYASDWSTTYAGHFLLLAREKGYHVSASTINSWVNYQRNKSSNWQFMKGDALNQAYRLYTLALAGKPNVSAMNRLREEDKLSKAARYRLAAAYALVGQKRVAMELIQKIDPDPDYDQKTWGSNYGSALRDQAMVLETYLLLDKKEEAFALYKMIAENLRSEQWMSTQTTAFALYAASLFIEQGDEDKTFKFKYNWNNLASGEIRPATTFFSEDLVLGKENKLRLENVSEKELFITLTKSGIAPLDQPVDIQNNLTVRVTYFNMDGQRIDEKNLPHGMDFYAVVEVQNTGVYGYLKNLALSQIFPSGWEIINTRMLDVGAELKSDKSDFIDFRDDRVNTFFPLGSGQSKRFVVILNAAYQGRYYLPATQCGDMYNNEVSSSVGGGWVNVNP